MRDTNNCRVKWDEIERYDAAKRKERESAGRISYVGSGPMPPAWPDQTVPMSKLISEIYDAILRHTSYLENTSGTPSCLMEIGA